MRIRNNKKSLIVNKEYSRLPYWTDEGYEDVQQSVSQKYVQDTYGAFAESENQLPYFSDADYQGLEYQYQNPEYFDPLDLPDVDLTNTAPKGTCYEYWLSLFGHRSGAFIPTSSEWNKLGEYQKKCPLIYMPHICCLNMKINGPSSLTPGQEANYTVSGGDTGCAYDMKASGGEFVGNKYFAPSTPGTYELYITPWMSDDKGKKCASISVTVQSASCTGVIGYTTLQMATSATQTLTVTGGAVGDVYTWTTTSGSFDTDTGTSVVYTAQSSNANCSSNPTISLSCGGSVVSTITIAINAYSAGGVGYLCEITNPGSCRIVYYPPGVIHSYVWEGLYYTRWALQCNGDVTMSGLGGPLGAVTYASSGGSCGASYSAAIGHTGDCYCVTEAAFTGSWGDCRAPAEKHAGCCPQQLMSNTRACRYC